MEDNLNVIQMEEDFQLDLSLAQLSPSLFPSLLGNQSNDIAGFIDPDIMDHGPDRYGHSCDFNKSEEKEEDVIPSICNSVCQKVKS